VSYFLLTAECTEQAFAVPISGELVDASQRVCEEDINPYEGLQRYIRTPGFCPMHIYRYEVRAAKISLNQLVFFNF